ncbi:serine/threonine-protein kinase [Hyalangium versicolor]|uniref:serine/threonine-protein kinase n=1 Tax=Hyalangium versicolor TaxID=2861190 RepID=UPI001CCB9C67|nr:serine/threonine-protein kinase [Hyalangium versicolor]
MHCLQENTLVALGEGRLSPDERLRADAHIDACPDCRALLAAWAQVASSHGIPLPTGSAPTPKPPAWDAEELPPGSKLGRYLILHRVGSGGMGVVYAAYDPQLDRRVALKLLRRRRFQGAEQEADARLLREAQVVARLNHPHVITVYDAGTLGEQVFLTMEFVEGGTLAQWLREKPRAWSEVLEIFLSAGRGLAAAHAEGLVHRDFKPDNVLVGKDGRVRVMDFGLARRLEAPEAPGEPSAPPGPPSLVPTLTRTGAIVGTPAYMAPEQHEGQPTDARSDQFSFCVALYEALYGERPFSAASQQELARQVTTGAVRAPPKGAPVPEWLRRVLLRGLSPLPSARHPSMEALLVALARDPRAVLRRRVGWGAAAVLTVSLIAGGGGMMHQRTAQVCRGAERKLVGTWDAPRQEQVRAAFLATALPYAPQAWRGVESLLNKYAADWTAMYTEACEATQVRGEQSAELMDLRMQCLGQRLAGLKGLAEAFSHADAMLVQKAVQAAGSLPELSECASVTALTAPVRPPSDAATRAKVEALHERLGRTWTFYHSGRFAEGRKAAEADAVQARALGYRPLEAEALYIQGLLAIGAGDPAQGEQVLNEALWAAQAGGHQEVLAKTAVALLEATGVEERKHAEARRWNRFAEASLERLGGNPSLDAERLLRLGTLARDEGNLSESLGLLDRALAAREKLLGPEHLEVSDVLQQKASTLIELHRDEALATFQRALAIREKLLGPEHPAVASSLRGMGFALMNQGKSEQALPLLQRSLAINEKALGPEHPTVGTSLDTLAIALRNAGRPEESLPLTKRALAIEQKALGPDHPLVGTMLHNLGQCYEQMGDPRHELEYMLQALANWEKAVGPDHSDVAMALTGAGGAYVELHEPKPAIPLLERALRITDTGETDSRVKTEIRYFLAQALWDAGKDRRRAVALMQEARKLGEGGGDAARGDLTLVQEWFKAHRL